MVSFLLYLLLQLDELKWGILVAMKLLVFVVIIIAMGAIIQASDSTYTNEDFSSSVREDLSRTRFFLFVKTLLFLFILYLFLPSSKNLAMVIGGGTVYEVITSPEAKAIGGKTLSVLEHQINKLLEEEKKNEQNGSVDSKGE